MFSGVPSSSSRATFPLRAVEGRYSGPCPEVVCPGLHEPSPCLPDIGPPPDWQPPRLPSYVDAVLRAVTLPALSTNAQRVLSAPASPHPLRIPMETREASIALALLRTQRDVRSPVECADQGPMHGGEHNPVYDRVPKRKKEGHNRDSPNHDHGRRTRAARDSSQDSETQSRKRRGAIPGRESLEQQDTPRSNRGAVTGEKWGRMRSFVRPRNQDDNQTIIMSPRRGVGARGALT